MPAYAIDWGDVPTWVSATTTFLALAAAGFIVLIELRRDKRAVTARERAEQADQVAVWKAQTRPSGPKLLVHNGSNLPIYQVQVRLRHPVDGVRSLLQEGQLPPGDHGYDYPDEVLAYDELGNLTLDSSDEWEHEIQFVDTASRAWKRWGDGVLTRLPDIVARTTTVPPESRTTVVPPDDAGRQ